MGRDENAHISRKLELAVLRLEERLIGDPDWELVKKALEIEGKIRNPIPLQNDCIDYIKSRL